ncbi:glycosyl hydrolase [Saprospiraceae bacterium]|nr:glycosyl hydrolase [Saprospiraceae bacterium]
MLSINLRLSLLSLIVFTFLSSITQAQIDLKYAEAIEWREIGPYRGGRSCAVTGVAGKDNLYYFGSTGGGIWKTLDGGRSWENISDGFFGGSIGAIAVSESDNNVIVVGGGEKTVRGNVSYGYGVWKTEDGGKTWEQKGLKTSRHISRIRIDPNDHNIIYAAVMGDLFMDTQERGIYKSIDGGDTWRKVLFANERSGAVDLIIDPNNPRHLYASTWNIRRTPYSLSSGGDGSSIWKSIDYGETWENISSNKGLPEGVWGISGITVSPVNSDRVWAILENEKGGGVYRSDDAGEKWIKVNDSRSLRQRAWYYTRIYADPKDIDGVYVMNVSYHKSNDGGKTFTSKRAPHGDHHDLWIAPDNPDRMIIGDDGGAQVTYDGGETWSTYHNQPTAQFYRVTTDNHFPYRIYAAQQDNSTIRISHRTDGRDINERDWESTAGGESAHIAVDPEDNDIVYGGSYDGYLTRINHRTGSRKAINVWPDNPMGHGAEDMKYRFQWNFPIFFSKHDPNKLYTASNHLHLSTDEGQSWTTISDDLTRNDSTKLKSSGGPITQDNTSVEYYCTIFAAAESPVEEGVIWVGSDDGLLHITKDGGANWQNITPTNMPTWLMINCIEPDPHDTASCYIAGTLYKEGDYKPYIYKTENYGQSWAKIVNGIDKEHFTRAVRVDPNSKGTLYAGTESGVYVSTNDGRQWHPMQLNLPIVPITDITLKNDNLIVATQGRGLWMIDDLSVLRETMSMTNSNTEYALFSPSPAYRMRGGQSKNTKGAGTNHPAGVGTYFYLSEYDEKKDTLSITYLNNAGDTIRTFSNHSKDKATKLKDIKAGANKHQWNMKYADAKGFDGMILWWGSTSGATVVPGDYQVHMSINGFNENKSFEIMGDPRLKISDDSYELQQEFIESVNSKVTEAHEAIIEMRDLKKQMKEFKSSHKDSVINVKIEEIDSVLTKIEKELYQTKNKSRQDPLNFPIRLTNKLAHINSLVQIGDGAPPKQMYEVRDDLTERIDVQLNKYEAIKEDLPELNKLIREQVTDFIKVNEK